MTIFFDLDGTLIDSRLRLYNLFQELVPQSKLTFEEYWELKRNKNNHFMILKNLFQYEENKINLFETRWMKLIEEDNRLKQDQPFKKVSEYLRSLHNQGIYLYVVTARQYTEKTFLQINTFGWSDIFRDILVTEQKCEKEDIMKPLLKDIDHGWIISDTGKDIQAGKKLGLNTAAVLSGFQNCRILSLYNPDLILSSVTDFSYHENN